MTSAASGSDSVFETLRGEHLVGKLPVVPAVDRREDIPARWIVGLAIGDHQVGPSLVTHDEAATYVVSFNNRPAAAAEHKHFAQSLARMRRADIPNDIALNRPRRWNRKRRSPL